jgi:hypothetical protein
MYMFDALCIEHERLEAATGVPPQLLMHLGMETFDLDDWVRVTSHIYDTVADRHGNEVSSQSFCGTSAQISFHLTEQADIKQEATAATLASRPPFSVATLSACIGSRI